MAPRAAKEKASAGLLAQSANPFAALEVEQSGPPPENTATAATDAPTQLRTTAATSAKQATELASTMLLSMQRRSNPVPGGKFKAMNKG
ncbi:unnamed protein product [Tilletia controversa]|uniref:Uncharacterized protein n=3 Tax=Tilletia TaxID=13289 RepID=A0A8X7SWZ8_9BASI|nr:hypothetical protein A4X06_0g4082 [Tilletia controversa]CAD6891571.1 unnamed protein product [Tilletia caries]CAD6965909.1 unnamed protein product [Tilletia laevis]CAD6897824.1 unnamed protein product [Tilletia caries]CAD6919237.1 unnamed protein product [Tilletia controversa]